MPSRSPPEWRYLEPDDNEFFASLLRPNAPVFRFNPLIQTMTATPTTGPTMPTSIAPSSDPIVTVSPATTPILCKGSIRRNKASGGLELCIDAKALHEHLDAIGIPKQSGEYLNGPYSGFGVVRDNTLSAALFLKVPVSYPLVVNLSASFESPPPYARLLEICRSADGVVRRILTHYEPIDISFTISKSLVA